MLDPLFDLITAVLAWFYSLWPSYGMAIAFLTLTTTIAVTPLTLKFTRSTLQMQQHMPELKKIQAQHRGDRQAINEATAAFYKEHGLNPVGCLLPMLVQAPIFLVMYRVVDGLTRRTTEIGTQIGFTSRRYADTALGAVPEYAETPIPRGDLAFDPDFLSRDTDLYVDLSGNLEMVSWGVDLSRSASDALSAGIIEALPYFLMILIVLVTSLVQQRQIQGRQSQAAMPPQQQMMMKLIPYMLPVFSYVMPGAVVVYFIVSTMVRIAQQAYITRSFYRGEDSLGAQVAKQRAAATDERQSEPGGKQRSAKSITEKKGAPTPKRDGGPAKGKAPSRKRGTGATGQRAPTPKRDGGPAKGKGSAVKRDGGPARGKGSAVKRDGGPAKGRGSAVKRDGGPARGKAPSRGRRADDSESQARERPSRRSGSGKTGKAPMRSRSSGRTTSGRTTAPGSAPKRSNPNRSRSKKKRR